MDLAHLSGQIQNLCWANQIIPQRLHLKEHSFWCPVGPTTAAGIMAAMASLSAPYKILGNFFFGGGFHYVTPLAWNLTWTRLALNSWSFCLSLLSAGIIGLQNHPSNICLWFHFLYHRVGPFIYCSHVYYYISVLCMHRSQDYLLDLLSPSTMWVPGGQTYVLSLGSKHLYPLSQLSSPSYIRCLI